MIKIPAKVFHESADIQAMSEVHDKIIAGKEDKILILDAKIKAKEESVLILKNGLEEIIKTTHASIGSLECGAHLIDVSEQLSAAIKRSLDRISCLGDELLKTMRETKASVVFETQQLKQVAADAKHFKESASDLKTAVELINSIRPTIKELMSNPEELNVIKEIIHACQSTAKNRERSTESSDQQAGPSPGVQVG